MGHEKESGGAMIAREALEVVPRDSKALAGESIGRALTNAAGALEDLTGILKAVTAIPAGAGKLMVRLITRRRRIPRERQVSPPATLLLAAAQAYSSSGDVLREKYENLLATAMDSDTADQAHPVYVDILGKMTAVEARLFDFLCSKGGDFHRYEDVGTASSACDIRDRVELGLTILVRHDIVSLRKVSYSTPDPDFESARYKIGPPYAGSAVIVDSISILEETPAGGATLVGWLHVYCVTKMGMEFFEVCSGKRCPARPVEPVGFTA